MKEKVLSINKIVMIDMFAIIFTVAFAIIVHAVVPAGVNTEKFDSVFVKLLGFPVVSVSYFVLLFIHCVVTMQYFGRKSNIPKLKIGFRFGLAFAILYFFGMQEVVVEVSPFREWGVAFVNYQFFIGVSDAIPVLLLCGAVAYFTFENAKTYISVKTLNKAEKIKTVTLITIAFLTERAIGYETGIITSSCNTYPIPCYIWTMIFGIVLGCSYVVLYPVFAKEQNKLLQSVKLVVVTIGVNWIIFNSFIGLILSSFMPQALLRSGIDVTIFFLTSIIMNNYRVSYLIK